MNMWYVKLTANAYPNAYKCVRRDCAESNAACNYFPSADLAQVECDRRNGLAEKTDYETLKLLAENVLHATRSQSAAAARAALDCLEQHLKPAPKWYVVALPDKPPVMPGDPFVWHCRKASARILGFLSGRTFYYPGSVSDAVRKVEALGLPFEVTDEQAESFAELGFKVALK